MIQIDNLTEEQVEMLDIMWSLDSMDDYFQWYKSLDTYNQKQADLLQRMVILAELDSLITDNLQDAKEVLKKFALH